MSCFIYLSAGVTSVPSYRQLGYICRSCGGGGEGAAGFNDSPDSGSGEEERLILPQVRAVYTYICQQTSVGVGASRVFFSLSVMCIMP